MFNFHFKKAKIYLAVRWEKSPFFKLAPLFKKIFLFLFIFALFLFLYGFFSENFSSDLNSRLFGSAILFLVFSLFFRLHQAFFNSKLKKPRLRQGFPRRQGFGGQVGGQARLLEEAVLIPENYNLAEFLSFDAAIAVAKSIRFARRKKLPQITSSVLLYFLFGNSKLNFIFFRALLDPKTIRQTLASRIIFEKPPPNQTPTGYSLDFQESIFTALKIAKEKGHQRIEIGDILTALAQKNPIFPEILQDFSLKEKDIESLASWLEYLEGKIEKSKRFWDYENLLKKDTLAKEWTAGYTVNLDQYSIDWTEVIKKRGFAEVIGHKKEIGQLERILAKSEFSNALLVGEPGKGRKSMILALTEKSLLGQSLPEVNYKRVVELDLPKLLAQLPSTEEVETTLDIIFREAVSAGNIILVIDEFHNYVGQGARPGVIDISGIITSYLRLPTFQIAAITTFVGLHKNIEMNPSLLSLFEKVEVSEISTEETLILLENSALALEGKHKKFISYPALREIISLTEKYLAALPFPEKAMEVLEETVIYVVQNTKDKILLPSHVQKIITEKTQIPVGEVEVKEREILLNLENLIHQRIINQEEAVKEVSSALRRARAEVTVRKGPMGAFLFLGPTGVGKTETSKALAEIYFGSGQRDKSLLPFRPDVAGLGEEKMIRLDMSEFQAIADIPRLIGSSGQEGLLTTPVIENPFSLILLDEIEKAHPNILNLFLQVFDEGHLTDGQGRKVDFKNSIIIATSNAGYQVILEAIKMGKPMPSVKEGLLDFLFKEGIFRPEFINRFDGVIVFKNLSKENLLDIAELLLQKLKANLKEKGIEFIINQPLKEKIVDLGYSPVFGARQMRRVIQDKVENPLASALLKGEIVRGSKVGIDPENFQLKINS